MKILITGATGFVGARLIGHLADSYDHILAGVRSTSEALPHSVEQVQIEDIYSFQGWTDVLTGVDVVIHLAAKVHIMNDKVVEPLTEFRRVNTESTINLAQQAERVGVRRFIFLSTIKVNGESTSEGLSFSEVDVCNPLEPYSISKGEAEQGLMAIARESGMEVVIIRPPLVYGPGVKGNFSNMIRWVNKGLPLPFAEVKNQRSLLALDNLISFITLCINHPNAANELFLLADGEDVSSTQLIEKLAHTMGKKAKLLPVPDALMKFVAGILGKKELADRLLESLQVDSSKARELLGWHPVVSIDEQLKNIVE